MFILPAIVIKRIERLLSSFLWVGEIKIHYGTRVGWKDICKLKDEGALGIIRLKLLKQWNQCLKTKQIWNICSKKDSLWIQKVHEVKLKGRFFWEVKIPADSSWMWRKIL